MNWNHFLRAISLFVLLATVASVLFVTVFANENDYSSPSATYTKEIYADEFLEDYVGITNLSQAEKDYLRLRSGFLFAYNAGIPTSHIKVSFDEGTLSVSAEEYVYSSPSGVRIVWTPVSASVKDKTFEFPADSYSVEFTGVDESVTDSVAVKYRASFVVSEETVNRLINLSYNDAHTLEDEVEVKRLEYESAYSEYLINEEKYNEYLASLAVYNAYLSEKRIYDEKNAEYLTYLAELREYEEALADYEAYVALRDKYYLDLAEYTKYLAYAEHNMAKIEEYEKYQEKIDTVEAQLDIIRATKTDVTSLGRDVYSAIIGGTVTSVIDRKGDIVKVLQADERVVDMAGTATENLRVLLKEFFDIPKNKLEEQYRYYITNYEGFRDNFVNLLVALDNLYLNSGVRGAMIAEGKHEKYVILVAQLYHIANALSDVPIKSYDGKYYFDSNYKIGSRYSADKQISVSEALENSEFIVDTNNATPLKDGYPIKPEVPEYKLMEEPVMPSPVTSPIKPEPVSKPDEPAPVSEPVYAQNPGKKPTPYVVPAEISALISSYNSGELFERDDYSGGDITITPEIDVSKKFINIDEITVTYYDGEYNSNEEKNILYQVTIDRNTYADYLGDVPQKQEDSEYVYSHTGWTDEHGNEQNLTCVSDSLNLYPKFSATEKEYETVWVINGERFYDNPGEPSIPMAEEFYFDFSGWKKTVDPETSDVTYIAVFDKPLVPTSSGAAKISYNDGNFVVEPSTVSNKFDISFLLERASGIGGIIIKTVRGEEFSISYSDTMQMYEEGVHSIGFSAVSGSDDYAYALFAYGPDGESISSSAKILFASSCEASDLSHFVLYNYNDAGEKKFLRYSLANGKISFNATPGVKYRARVEYSLTAVPLDAVNIVLNKTTASCEEVVSVYLEKKPGIRIDRIYTMGSDGKKNALDGTSFVMPSGDITVGVDYTVEHYRISFVSDGKTIVSYLLIYGDTVPVPQEPKKASNEKYSYTFLCWSPAVSTVDGNTTYNAVYSSELIPKSDSGNMEISRGVLKILLLLFVGAGCFVLIVVPSLIMTCIIISKRRKSVFASRERRKFK